MNTLNLQKFLAVFILSFLFLGTAQSASISGMAWQDTNADGIRMASEAAYANIYVILESPSGAQVDWKLTGANGQYSFTNVNSGTYRVKFANPGGTVFMSPINMGNDATRDNDADPYGFTNLLTVTAAQNLANIDGGFNTLGACFTPVTVNLISSSCDYMNTLDPSDDVVTMSFEASGGTGAWGWDYSAGNLAMEPYDVPKTISVGVVNGVATATINDHDNTFCTATIVADCPPPTGTLTLTCPAAIDVFADPCSDVALLNVVPTAITSTCPIGGVDIVQTSGPTNGKFPIGMSQICYKASDLCGNEKTCCTTVNVKEPCDTKKNGGIVWEVLDTEVDAEGQPVYHMRVTNNNSDPLMWVAFQIPNGMTAVSPANNSMYMAPSGRAYEVRNPNFSPFYSIRFKTKSTGLANGESDVFTYTLPQQANPWYINTKVRLYPKVFIEAHLDTWDCMPMPIVSNNGEENASVERFDLDEETLGIVSVFPNPASDKVWVDLEKMAIGTVHFQLFDMTGRLIKEQQMQAGNVTGVDLPSSSGLHVIRLTDSRGESWTERLLIK